MVTATPDSPAIARGAAVSISHLHHAFTLGKQTVPVLENISLQLRPGESVALLGPVPSTALLPLCLFIFPSSFGASVFLIALSTWFPVTVLTWSGVMGIDKAWYDVARTLGASQRFLILRVAIPAALPNVFVGLFMGLGASFSVLIVAEMVGVKSGIGFYLQWAQGWAAYPNMYAALLVMALLCSGLISGLFMLRDRLLSWQRGGMQW